jgi:hypothetical protein
MLASTSIRLNPFWLAMIALRKLVVGSMQGRECEFCTDPARGSDSGFLFCYTQPLGTPSTAPSEAASLTQDATHLSTCNLTDDHPPSLISQSRSQHSNPACINMRPLSFTEY